MEDILACRVCLATDMKLFNIFKYNLATTFSILIGTQVSAKDGMPQYLCTFCSALLRKCATFQDRSRRAQQLLNFVILHQETLTTDYIRTIDRETHNLTPPYSTHYNTIVKDEFIHKDIEGNTYAMVEEKAKTSSEENSSSSDEEPLAKKIVKKKRKKKRKNEEKYLDVEIKNETASLVDETDVNDDFDQNFDNDKTDFDCIDVRDDIDVVTLTKQQQIDEIQARKMSHNYLNSIFKCNKCFKGFMSDATYRNHMARHDPASGDHVCSICETRWTCVRSLRAHAMTSHERKYICKRCNHVSKSSHRAKEHCKWHDGYMYVCDICGASFSKSTSHLTHIRLHHPSGHSCDVCGESFIGEYGLNMHKKKAHRDTESTRVKSESQCVICGVQFRSLEALETHVNTSKDSICDPNVRSCVLCGCNFEADELLSEHIQELHQKDQTVNCGECNRKFANSRTYSVHYQHFHLGASSLRLRGRRAERRAPGQSAVCEVCGKQCMSKATLIYHQRTHTGEKPYQCSECPKRFSILQRLQIHLRTHTGERPFKCSHCPKAFKQKAALNRHDRVHSGAKPYGCPHCGKTFSQSNSMKMHVRTVHLKMPAPYRTNRKHKLE